MDIGEDVTIRYDPRDADEVWVFYQGAFLCRAVCPELAGEMVSLKDIVSARNRQRGELRIETRERQAVVEKLLAPIESSYHGAFPPSSTSFSGLRPASSTLAATGIRLP